MSSQDFKASVTIKANKLPHEILLKVFQILNSVDDRSNALWSCALVCRHWVRPALEVLSVRVRLGSHYRLANFYNSCSSTQPTIAGFVRSLTLAIYDGSASVGQLIANCLAHTIQLECLTFESSTSRFCTNLVVQRICFLLPKLSSLTFKDHSNAKLGAPFDPQLLLDLPKTLKRLDLENPSQNLLELLPEILQNLHRPRVTTAASHEVVAGPDLCAKKQSKCTTGLKSFGLALRATSPPQNSLYGHYGHPQDQPQPRIEVIAKLAPPLTSTLTSFVFQAEARFDTSVLIEFLSGTPLLEDLTLININFSSLFNRLKPLIHLRALKMQVPSGTSPEWLEVSRSLGHLIQHSRQFQAIDVYGDEKNKRPVSPLIDAIIVSTSHLFFTNKLQRICLRHFDAASVDALRRLFQSAVLLEYLEIGLPKGDLTSVAGALGRLKQIVHS